MGFGKFGLGCGCCEQGCPGPSSNIFFNNAKLQTPVVGQAILAGGGTPYWTSVVNNYPAGLRHKTNQVPGTYLESTYTADPFVLSWEESSPDWDSAITTGFHWMTNTNLNMQLWGYDLDNPSFESTLKVNASVSNQRTAGRYHLGGEFEFTKQGANTYTRRYRYYYGLSTGYIYGPWQGGLTALMTPMFQVRAELWPVKSTTVFGEPFTKLEYASIGAGWAGIVTAGSVPQTRKTFDTGLDLGEGDPACEWQWAITMSTEIDAFLEPSIPTVGFFGQWIPTGWGLYYTRNV